MSKKQEPENQEVIDSSDQDLTQEQGEPCEYKEKWQRAVADLENARKRFDQERATAIRFGTESLLEELLPVIDNFDRATSHVPDEQKNSPWVTGIQYIKKQLFDVLEDRGVKEIAIAVGDPFDHNTQEAIGTVQVEQAKDDTVVEVKNKGYRLHEKMLRPAQVIVGKSNI